MDIYRWNIQRKAGYSAGNGAAGWGAALREGAGMQPRQTDAPIETVKLHCSCS